MVHRNSTQQARLNAAKSKKKGAKKSKKVSMYVEKRPGSMAAKHLRSFRGLDHIRKGR